MSRDILDDGGPERACALRGRQPADEELLHEAEFAADVLLQAIIAQPRVRRLSSP